MDSLIFGSCMEELISHRVVMMVMSVLGVTMMVMTVSFIITVNIMFSFPLAIVIVLLIIVPFLLEISLTESVADLRISLGTVVLEGTVISVVTKGDGTSLNRIPENRHLVNSF